MSESALDLDFSRYAPVRRPALVVTEPDAQAPDELAQLGRVVLCAFGLIWRCIAIAVTVICSRIRFWLLAQYRRFTLSLTAAWLCAGFGWGGFVCLQLVFLLR